MEGGVSITTAIGLGESCIVCFWIFEFVFASDVLNESKTYEGATSENDKLVRHRNVIK